MCKRERQTGRMKMDSWAEGSILTFRLWGKKKKVMISEKVFKHRHLCNHEKHLVPLKKTLLSSFSCSYEHIPVIICKLQMFSGMSSFALSYCKNNVVAQ